MAIQAIILNSVFNFGKIKEYNVLNYMDKPLNNNNVYSIEYPPKKLEQITDRDELIRRLRHNMHNYANYFEYLGNIPRNALFTGDFSPNYWNIT